MSANFTTAPANALLATLPAPEWERAAPHCKPICLARGAVLYGPSMAVDQIYFPTTSVISVGCVMNDGRADAVALVGREGLLGVELLLGFGSPRRRAVVLGEGWAYRIARKWLNEEYARGGAIRGISLRYVQSYITQVAQTTVCNRHHSIDQQVCRWLLMFLDRRTSNEVPMTHEHIAELMGVRRESVSEAAHKLQASGYIRNGRGCIAVVERSALEDGVCECYEIVKRETDRLLRMSQLTESRRAIAPTGDRVNIRLSTFTAQASPPFCQ